MRRFMFLWARLICAGTILATGCQVNAPSGAPTSTADVIITGATALTPTAGVAETVQATASAAPATDTPSSESTATPTGTLTPRVAPGAKGAYMDDRSDATRVMASFVQALNRWEFVRAYSYWESSDQAPTYAQFEQGYSNTQSVSVTLGAMTGDAGAGQFYTTVPATLVAMTKDGAVQTFVGCYVLHLANPGAQAALPFKPLAIRSAVVQHVANDANTATLMAQACNQHGIPQGSPIPTPGPNSDPAQRYIDDRSGPVQLMQSFANALNRREYLRAYSYWEPAAQAELPAYPEFVQGYTNTQAVSVTFGVIASDAGAGHFNYTVPATLNVTNTDGKRQTFVGCYKLHLANPGLQVAPFQSLGLTSGSAILVDENADTAALMKQSCPSNP